MHQLSPSPCAALHTLEGGCMRQAAAAAAISTRCPGYAIPASSAPFSGRGRCRAFLVVVQREGSSLISTSGLPHTPAQSLLTAFLSGARRQTSTASRFSLLRYLRASVDESELEYGHSESLQAEGIR